MQSPSIDGLKSDLHIYSIFFLYLIIESYYYFGGKNQQTMYISMLTYISWSSSALWLSSYSLYDVHRSKHLLFLSICLENVNIKQTQLDSFSAVSLGSSTVLQGQWNRKIFLPSFHLYQSGTVYISQHL